MGKSFDLIARRGWIWIGKDRLGSTNRLPGVGDVNSITLSLARAALPQHCAFT